MNPMAVNGARSPIMKLQWKPYYQRLLRLRERLLSDRAKQLIQITEPPERAGRDLTESGTDESSQDLALSGVAAEQSVFVRNRASHSAHAG